MSPQDRAPKLAPVPNGPPASNGTSKIAAYALFGAGLTALGGAIALERLTRNGGNR